jgi:hypothetical protein
MAIAWGESHGLTTQVNALARHTDAHFASSGRRLVGEETVFVEALPVRFGAAPYAGSFTRKCGANAARLCSISDTASWDQV